ncbi:MAG: hypothetical protein CMI85_00160 [Candidatus Pelagibacter sp.]|nr:hypothetical protein [Candidatus Pelagibacter sp.]
MLKVENLNKLLFFFFLFLLFEVSAFSKPLPQIVNYSPSEYGALTQNWGVTEDKDGRIYFANNNGVLIYDGSNWKLISLPDFKSARSISSDPSGNVIVGSRGSFGFIKNNNIGEPKFVSLSKNIPKYRSNSAIYETHIIENGSLFFRTFTKLFLVKNNVVTVINNPFKKRFSRSFYVNKKIYIFVEEKGLYHLELNTKKFNFITDTKFFNTKSKIINGFEKIENQNIYLTRRAGIFLSDSNGIKKIEYKNPKINNTTIYRTIKLKNSNLALATYDGIFILDKNLKIINHIDSKKGLRTNNVRSLYEDSSGNLWAGLNDGISKILLSSQFRFYPKILSKTGGNVYDLDFFNNEFYISSSTGLRKLVKNQLTLEDHFEPVAINFVKSQTWALLPLKKNMIIGHLGGLGFIDKKENYSQIFPKKITGSVYSLKKSKIFENKFYVGSKKGLFILDIENLKNFIKIPEINNSVWRIVEIADKKNIWVFNEAKGIYKIHVNDLKNIAVTKYTKKDGLPFNNKLYIVRYKKNLIVGSKKGVYQFNYQNNKFEKSKVFTDQNLDSKPEQLIRMIEINNQNIFHTVHYKNFKRIQKFYSIQNDKLENFPIPEVSNNIFVKYHYFKNDKIYFTSNEGVGIFNYNNITNKNNSKIIFSKILNNEKPFYYGGNNVSYDKDNFKIRNKFNYNENNFHFYVSATDYLDEKNNLFNGYLIKNKKNLNQQFTKDKKFSFSNLTPGKYNLLIEAKNARNQMLEPLKFNFFIKKPWWQTIYFYIGEIIFFMILLFITILSKQNNASQKYATALTFIMILILFEYVNFVLDPLFYNLTGGVPIFNILSKVLLGVLLKPIENLAEKLLDLSSQYLVKKKTS